MSFFGEPREPVLDQLESLPVDEIDPRSALLLVRNQPGIFENLNVTSRGWPGVLEDLSNFAGTHRPTFKIQSQHDAPPGWVRKGRKDRFVGVHTRLRLWLWHRAIFSE